MGDKIAAEVLRCMDEAIDDLLAEKMTAIISPVLSKSFQDQLRTILVMGNIIYYNFLSMSIERSHLNDLISELLITILGTENKVQVMTNNTLGSQSIIAPVARFVKRNT